MQFEAILPAESYLASRYHDKHRGLTTRRIYFNDGRVEAYDGETWWLVCTLNAVQIERLKSAILDLDQDGLDDLVVAARKLHDTAELTYAWALPGYEHQFTNAYYPAHMHPAMVQLEETIFQVEDEARGLLDT